MDYMSNRLEANVREFEATHSVSSRWTSDCMEYKEVIANKNVSRRQKLKSELKGLVRERIFYTNTIAHHTGVQHIHMFIIA